MAERTSASESSWSLSNRFMASGQTYWNSKYFAQLASA